MSFLAIHTGHREYPVNTPEEVVVAKQAMAAAGEVLEPIYEWKTKEDFLLDLEPIHTHTFLRGQREA